MPTVALDRRGLTIAYDDRGAGRPLVLLHAFPLDRTMWRPQLDALAGPCRVLAPDLPGFGESTAGNDPFTIDTAADVVAEFLAAAGVADRVILGGLSMGGYVALAFAHRHPDRLAGLILADTRSGTDDAAGRANRDTMIALANEQGSAAVVEKMLPKVLAEHARPELVETVRGIGSRQSPAAVAAALAALRDRPDATPALPRIAVPTLVLVGEKDAVTPPAMAEALAKAIPGSRLVTIPGVGHLSNLENPSVFNEAVEEFVRQQVK